MVKGIFESTDIVRLEIPRAIVTSVTAKGNTPNTIEFWIHRDSSTAFLVKPQKDYRLVHMALEQDMSRFVT